ncbi:hypothetical protein [Nitrosomonas sp.]|uniref:hypothetical protein n=1 Tax=Nitrosomonas sp. TaxID=42353 RepID=UPI001DA1DB20|nr:hypothetical protein [Nitrosomonas sp.]MBX3616208.1 hypothetical protein [Nitrosomonas sp.]
MKKILLLIIISLMFSTNVYAKKAKGGVGKGGLSAKSAPAQTNKTPAPAAKSAPAHAPAANTAVPAANASAQKPSLLQSAMPALVGGAVGSYVGSKLASDGETDNTAVEAEKKDGHPLTTR